MSSFYPINFQLFGRIFCALGREERIKRPDGCFHQEMYWKKWASSFSKFPFLVNFSANENGCGLAWGWMRNVNRSWSHFYQLFTKAAAHYNSLCEILDTISNYKLAFRFFQEKSSSHPPNYQKDRIIERIPHSTLLLSIIAFTPSRFPCSVFSYLWFF